MVAGLPFGPPKRASRKPASTTNLSSAEAPYPLIDVASVMLAAGMDPIFRTTACRLSFPGTILSPMPCNPPGCYYPR